MKEEIVEVKEVDGNQEAEKEAEEHKEKVKKHETQKIKCKSITEFF